MSAISTAIVLDKVSPVQDKSLFLYQWDSQVRKAHSKYEAELVGLREGFNNIGGNIFLGFKDRVQFARRF